MTFEPDEILSRFHRALVRELQTKNPEHLQSPFSVAEIYQNLVPYRTHRDEIGVEMSADYEHALLRLLAGEGDFLTIESRTARQEIREELESPNPNTGLYRDFAAADVRLNPDRVEEALAWITQGAGEPSPQEEATELVEGGATGEEAAPAEVEVVPEAFAGEVDLSTADGEVPAPQSAVSQGLSEDLEVETGEVPADASLPEEVEPVEKESEVSVSVPDNCPWCRENLPKRPGVRFCPFCGSNVRLAPCPECGEELELNWRFCIACGTEVAS